MKIFHVERTDRYGYDEWDSFVVIAPNAYIAKRTWPEEDGYVYNDTNCRWEYYSKDGTIITHNQCYCPWVTDLGNLRVTYLGMAREGYPTKTTVIMSSFNAG